MNKLILGLVVSIFVFTGCAAHKAQKQFAHELRVTMENAVMSNEPCNITCGKIKRIVESYKGRLK